MSKDSTDPFLFYFEKGLNTQLCLLIIPALSYCILFAVDYTDLHPSPELLHSPMNVVVAFLGSQPPIWKSLLYSVSSCNSSGLSGLVSFLNNSLLPLHEEVNTLMVYVITYLAPKFIRLLENQLLAGEVDKAE